MAHNANTQTTSKSITTQTTQLPGVDNSKVIPSDPDLVKEGSTRVSNKKKNKSNK